MTKASLQPHHGIPQSPRRGIMQIPDKMSSVWQFWQVSQFYIYSLSLNADYHIVFKDSSNKMAALVEAFSAYCDTGVYNDVKIAKPYF